MHKFTIIVLFLVNIVVCRDFYVGMFRKNDILVAQDTVYKERFPFRAQVAKYGRYFKCPITYFRVLDRLGSGRGPKVQIIRGGLRHRYVVLKMTSAYNMPISVNVYVGCENKMVKVTTKTATTTKATAENSKISKTTGSDSSNSNKTDVPVPNSDNNNTETTEGGSTDKPNVANTETSTTNDAKESPDTTPPPTPAPTPAPAE